MVTKHIVTEIKASNSWDKKCKSLVDVIAWNLEKNFEKPETISLRMPLIIPTISTKNPNLKLINESVQSYKQFLEEKYSYILHSTEKELNEIIEKRKDNPEKKDKKTKIMITKEKKIEHITYYLEEIEKIRVKKIQEGNYTTFHLIGPHTSSTEREMLPNIFVKESLQQQARRRINYYRLLEDEKPSPRSYSIDDLLNVPLITLDFETANWEDVEIREHFQETKESSIKEILVCLSNTHAHPLKNKDFTHSTKIELLKDLKQLLNDTKNERVTGNILTNGDLSKNYLLSTINHKKKSDAFAKIPGTDIKIDSSIVQVEDQKDLVRTLCDLLKMDNYLGIAGHNTLKFDYGKVQELTNNFKIGIDGKTPLHKAQIPGGFIVQRIIEGYMDLDFAGYAQHAMDTRNNKLDTIVEFNTGIEDKKTLNHAELSEMTKLAENGNLDALNEWDYYTIQDGIKNALNARGFPEKLKFLLPENLKKDFKGLAREIIFLSHLFNSRTARICTTSKKSLVCDYWTDHHYEKFKTAPFHALENVKFNEDKFNDFNSFEYLHKRLNLTSKKGVYNAKVFSFFPFSKIFSRVLKDHKKIKQLDDLIIDSNNDAKTRLLKYKEKIAEYPLFRTFIDSEKRFATLFKLGFSNKEIEYFNEEIEYVFQTLEEIKESGSIINYSQHLFVLDQNISEEHLAFFKNYGPNLGNHKIISGPKKRFVNLEMQMMKGVADYQSGQGERNNSEKEFYKNFLNHLTFDDYDTSINYLIEFCHEINNLKKGYEDIVYRRKAGKDSINYSRDAKQNHVLEAKKRDLLKGDLFEYTKSFEENKEKLFGKHGSISRIVSWIFEPNKEVKTILQRVYASEHNDLDLQILKVNYLHD